MKQPPTKHTQSSARDIWERALFSAMNGKWNDESSVEIADKVLDAWKQRFADGTETHAPVQRTAHQPIITDAQGVRRFKSNPIVSYFVDLCDSHNIADMNSLGRMTFSDEDRAQFAELIGYSTSGFSELSYVSDEFYSDAMQGEDDNDGEGKEKL